MDVDRQEAFRLSYMAGNAARLVLMAHGAMQIESYEISVERAAQQIIGMRNALEEIRASKSSGIVAPNGEPVGDASKGGVAG